MILGLVQEAVEAGARQDKACEILGIDPRSVQRWKTQGIGEDRRAGPRREPGNKLTRAEKRRLVRIINSPEYRDLSPRQIVPLLADQGIWVASESTIYRILKENSQLTHRQASRPPRPRPAARKANGRNQVWSQDITYLRSPVRGAFFYLYMVLDIWSRKIVGWEIHDSECGEHASRLIGEACAREGIDPEGLVLHSDNGSPMKGATLQATLERLGIVSSFSRPRVSDDNAFSEALFRTVKYRPEYPGGPFTSLEAAREWVAWFVAWYNTEHRHSAIGFVTPEQRHDGSDRVILANRRCVYAAAKRRTPERWSGEVRNWSHIAEVVLNDDRVDMSTGAA